MLLLEAKWFLAGLFFAVKDPRVNSALNPRVNSALNPRVNSALNPRVNNAINPRVNSSYGGPYIYSLDLIQEGFVVRTNEVVELRFNLGGDFIGIIVHVGGANVSVMFDENNIWTGYLVKANEDVSLKFDEQGNWNGLIV